MLIEQVGAWVDKTPEIYYYYITRLLYYQIQELKYKQITFVRELESKEEMIFQ